MSLTEDTIVREFLLRDAANKSRIERGEAPIAIMHVDLAAYLGVNSATVRKVLKERGLWEERHRNMSKVETLRRINESKRKNGFPSLQRQRANGFSNLAAGRAKLAHIYAANKEAQSSEEADMANA